MPTARLPAGPYRPSDAVALRRVKLRQVLLSGQSDEYEFPFAPINLSYEGLASEWVEINRAGQYPLIQWKAPRLAKVSFEARIVDRLSGGIESVDADLMKLRSMALRVAGVRLEGMDLLVEQFPSPALTVGRLENAWYHFTGFSIKSVNRKIIGDRHAIVSADVSIELTETRNTFANVVPLPRIFYPVETPEVAAPGSTFVDNAAAVRTYTQLIAELRRG